ncbi:MAG: hypothetical protein CME60_06815 [Halobacteriovoraceae bacterium]|nr:hypothetical protein [Halobacteriovoraceae bacterium]
MALNLRVFEVPYYPDEHPRVHKLPQSDGDIQANCSSDHTKDKQSPLDKKAMDERVHRQFENLSHLQKLDLL